MDGGTIWMTSYPQSGLCKTPTILWIRSIATLCWKLLKPVNQKNIILQSAFTLNECICGHARSHTCTHALTHDIGKLLQATESARRLASHIHTHSTVDCIDRLHQYRLLLEGKLTISMDWGHLDHVNLCSASTTAEASERTHTLASQKTVKKGCLPRSNRPLFSPFSSSSRGLMKPCSSAHWQRRREDRLRVGFG